MKLLKESKSISFDFIFDREANGAIVTILLVIIASQRANSQMIVKCRWTPPFYAVLCGI